MKKIMITGALVMSLVFGLSVIPETAFAGGHRRSNHSSHYRGHHGSDGWETAGAILAGVVGLAIITDALTSPSYAQPYYTTTTYYPEPVYVQQPCKVWVDGYYADVAQQVWVPGYYTTSWIGPVYDWVWTDRGRQQVMISAGHYEKVWVPGCYQTKYVKTWVPGY